jgi:hypothetical protein
MIAMYIFIFTAFILARRVQRASATETSDKTIMRKAVFVISLAALFVTAGPNVNAYVLERLYNYYPDSTFVNACGYVDMACGTTYSDGCTTNWRYAEIFICESGEQTSAHCQEWNGTQWVDVACPDETVTVQSRISVPDGRQ